MKQIGKTAVLLICLLSFGISCSHKKVLKETPSFNNFFDSIPRQLTFYGNNEHPRFSKDGTRILYSSRGRSHHKGSQIYEMDLTTGKERRVVYSDGDAFDATYISDYEIIYSSTTDEIKENPLANKIFDKEYPPSDLYMSDLFGNDILRLTMQPSFDGEAAFFSDEENPFILFTSRRGDLTGIYRLDLENLPVSLIAAHGSKERRYPVITPDKKSLIWVEKDLKSQEQKIVLFNIKSKTTSFLKTGDTHYRDLFFAPRSPDRLFYSVLKNGQQRYQIEVYDLKKQCTQQVYKATESILTPAVSSDNPERLAFTKVSEDKMQIQIMTIPKDLGPCTETPLQATLKE